MKPDHSSIDRVVEYLLARREGASSVEIAREVLLLSDAGEKISERLVSGMLREDGRAFRAEGGFWKAAPVAETMEREESLFHVLAVREARNIQGKKTVVGAAVVTIAGHQAEPPVEYLFHDEPEEIVVELCEELADLFASGVVVAFDRGKSVRALRSFVESYAEVPTPETLSLQRLGKRFLGLNHHPSLPELCDQLGMGILDEGDPASEAAFLGELFLRLREEGAEKGAVTLESLFDAQTFRPKAVDFSRYAFGERFLRDLPKLPGVYSMYDMEGELLYVGKTKNLHQRVNSYFKSSEDRPKKTTRLLESLYHIEILRVGSDLEAELEEARMIRMETPEVNVQEKIHKRHSAGKTKPNVILVLPSADPDSVELFLLRKDFPLQRFRMAKDGSNEDQVFSLIETVYSHHNGLGLVDPDDAADVELVRSCLARHRDSIHQVDLDATAGPEETLARLWEEIRELDDLY